MSTPDEREPAPLRSDALRMIATWREADAMPRAAKARVWKRVRERDEAPRRPPLRYDAALWAFAIAAAVLLVWWGVASLGRDAIADEDAVNVEAVDRHDATPSERVAVEPNPRATPSVDAAPSESSPAIAPPVQTPAATPRSAAPRPRTEPPRSEPPTQTETTALARERDLIARAWSALADGDHDAALLRAAEHEEAFPDGLLVPERRAIEVIARCKRGDRGASEASAEWIAAQPRSPLANRVRVACQ